MNTSTDDTTITPAEVFAKKAIRVPWDDLRDDMKKTVEDAMNDAITAFLAQAKGPTDEEIAKAFDVDSCTVGGQRHIKAFKSLHAAEMARKDVELAQAHIREDNKADCISWRTEAMARHENEITALKSSLATAERDRNEAMFTKEQAINKQAEYLHAADKAEQEVKVLRQRVAELEKSLTFVEDAASKGDLARQNAAGMEMEIKELRGRVVELDKEAYNKEVESYGHPGFNECLDERNILGKQPSFTLPPGASLDPSKHLTPPPPPSTPGPS